MPTGYRSVAFVGDWFRCEVPEVGNVEIVQAGNVRWLSHLLAPALEDTPLKHVMPLAEREAFARQLGCDDLLRRYRANSPLAWAEIFDGVLPDGCFDELLDQIDSGDLVVGFEIPPVLRRTFDSRRIGYISLHNHPLRFLKDLAFGTHSNDPVARLSLASVACDERDIEREVSRQRARFSRLDPVQTRLPDNCPVLFGQTQHDASLIQHGRFAHWADHASEIATALQQHQEVAFVKHPHARWSRDVLEFLRTDLCKTVIAVSGNSYPLIMSGRLLGPVLTLSSSIGAEAAAFGYDTQFLVEDPRTKFGLPGTDNDHQIMTDHRLLEPAFWRELMAGSRYASATPKDPFFLGADYIRGTLENWGAAKLNSAYPFEDMDKVVLPSASASDREIDELASALGGGNCGASPAAAGDVAHRVMLAQRPLALGGEWHWSFDYPLSELAGVNGFDGIDGNGSFIVGPAGEIAIPRGGDALGRVRLSGEIEFSFFSGILPENPAALLFVDDRPVAALCRREGEDLYARLTFDAAISPGKWCQIRVECSHAAAPAELGLGSDPRPLSVVVHKMKVCAQPRLETGDTFPLRIWGVDQEPISIF